MLIKELQWCHHGRDGVSKHQPHDCLLNCLFRRRSKQTSKLREIGLCAVNSSVTGEFPAQRASNAEIVSIWWRHHGTHWILFLKCGFGSQHPVALFLLLFTRPHNTSSQRIYPMTFCHWTLFTNIGLHCFKNLLSCQCTRWIGWTFKTLAFQEH